MNGYTGTTDELPKEATTCCGGMPKKTGYMGKALYRVTTRGCGVFYVIAASFDYAAGEVTRELNAQDYGYSGNRAVTNVEFVCRETFMQNGRRALYGDNDENHLMITKED